MPTWLATILKLFATPPAAPSAPVITPPVVSDAVAAFQALSTIPFATIAQHPLTAAGDVLGAMAALGVPWAGTADDLLTLMQVGYALVQAGVITPGQEYPDAGKHSAGR